MVITIKDQLFSLRGRRERESLGLLPKEFQCLFIWQTFMDSFCETILAGWGYSQIRHSPSLAAQPVRRTGVDPGFVGSDTV